MLCPYLYGRQFRINIDKALASCRYLQKGLPTLTPIAKIEDFGMENFC